jgi:hypothetical protein
MSNIITESIDNYLGRRERKRVDSIVNDIETTVRQTINQEITRNSNMPAADREAMVKRRADALDTFGASITGILKKRFAPNRIITDEGVFSNRFNMTDMYTNYVGENLVKFSTDKYTEAAIRNGGYIDSKNPTVVKYLNKRIREFAFMSKTSEKEFQTDFFISLMLYGNIGMVRHRQEKASSGKPYVRWDGKRVVPIASLYIEDFRKLIIGERPSGKVRIIRTKEDVSNLNFNSINPAIWNVERGGELVPFHNPLLSLYHATFGRLFKSPARREKSYVIYDEDDISHIRYHHMPGEKIAMPPFWPTINDIDSLRRIEENIELLIYQYGHPILHGTVGDEKQRGSTDEIADLASKIQGMESNGFLITDNRAMIDMVGAESRALRLEAYLLYFYRRVLTGLWLSEVTVGIGDTSNRSTANTLDKLSQEKVVEIQQVYSSAMQQIYIELLQEAGANIDWILRPENIPEYKFKPIDIEGMIKMEAHTLTKWEAGMLQEDEMRREQGKEPFTDEERKKTYTFLHAIPLAEAAPAMEPTPGKSQSNKVTQQKLRPTNQHGRKSGPSQSQNS